MEFYLKALKNYAKFDGRAHQAEYWYFFLFNFIASFLLGLVDGALGMQIIGTIYSLAVLVPSIAVGVRRMHDVGKSGWFLIIPLYNIYLMCLKGEEGTNQYGPNPLNPEGDISEHLVD